MKSQEFFNVLKERLMLWTSKGLISPEAQNAILAFESTAIRKERSFTFGFALLGIILFATGVITFFAANWGYIPKILKLIILFAALWSSYLYAYYCAQKTEDKPFFKSETLFILLGNLLFGANIWLIAQMFHIDAYYPTGVLIWSLGALLAAYLLKDSISLYLSIILGMLWTILYFWTLRALIPHFGYLILLAFQFLWLVLYPHRKGFILISLAILVWVQITSLVTIQYVGLEFYTLLGLSLFFIGNLLPKSKYKMLKHTLQYLGLILAFSYLFLLTFPQALSFSWTVIQNTDAFYPKPMYITFPQILIMILLNVSLMAGIYFFKRNFKFYTAVSGLVLFLFLALLTLNDALSFQTLLENVSLVSIAYNLLFFIGTLWLIQLGGQRRDTFMINVAFIFFSLGLFFRYFDTFWTLLNRSVFFMVGGLLLLLGSYAIEKQRRKITRKIKQTSKQEKNT